MIRPVEIFQGQNQASIRRDGFQRFAHLAHHPLACGSENLLLKSLLLISSYQRRKLYQPGRRAQGQSLDRKSRIRMADKAAQRFEQGVIGFLASVSFYALAAGNSQVWMTIDLVREGINQGRFAYARLASHKNKLTPPPQSLFQMQIQLCEGRLPTHEFSRAMRVRIRKNRRAFTADWSNKLIPPLRQGFDEEGLRRLISE